MNFRQPAGAHDSSNLIGFIWAHRRDFLPGLALAVGRVLVIAPMPVIFQNIVDRQMPAKNVVGIGWLVFLTLMLLLVHQWLSVRGATSLGSAVTHIVLKLRARILEKIQYLSFAWLDRQKSGKLLSKYVFDTQKVDAAIMPIVNSFVPDGIYSLVTFVILVVMNWQMAVVVVLMLPVFTVMRWYYFERFQRRYRESRVAQEKLTGTANETFAALRLVRSYGEEEQVASQLEISNREVARTRLDLIATASGFGAFTFASIRFLTLLVIAGGALLAIDGKITAGEVLAFVAGVPVLVNPIQMFAQISDQYFNGQEGCQSIKELLDSSETENWRGAKVWRPVCGKIEFDHVSFSYSKTRKGALHDFCLVIHPGERVALVGPSGSGKTTIANLLLGLYRPNDGIIRIDGVPQVEIDMRWFRQNTAMVMQESILLSGTIEDNIRFARCDASDDEVRKAIRLANVEEFIQKLPHGYQTVIGERGATLSGGQRQRIAIARAILRTPAILILDEPTSALDYESERQIQTALENLEGGRTVITIAHRLSTIRNADRVLVLENGRVIEQGGFKELAARNGYFSSLLAAQNL
ncbi:MAG: ABC transporter ATP-binding protein [Chthoniobacteraceae bacterium]